MLSEREGGGIKSFKNRFGGGTGQVLHISTVFLSFYQMYLYKSSSYISLTSSNIFLFTFWYEG